MSFRRQISQQTVRQYCYPHGGGWGKPVNPRSEGVERWRPAALVCRLQQLGLESTNSLVSCASNLLLSLIKNKMRIHEKCLKIKKKIHCNIK